MITLTREEAQQVLDALKELNKLSIGANAICLPAEIDDAMETLRNRLAQPEPEPVAWSVTLEGEHIGNFYIKQQDAEEAMHDLNKDWPQWVRKAVPLYTAPPQREWQGLTDEEIDKALWENESNYLPDIIRIAEAKLKEKNA